MRAVSAWGVIVLCLVVSLDGCEKPKSNTGGPKAILTGKVTYKGEAVPGGNISFFPKAGGAEPTRAKIEPSGTYTAPLSFVGEARVMVETESLNVATAKKNPMFQDPTKQMQEMKDKGKGMPTGDFNKFYQKPISGTYKKIPSKYADPEKTPLTITVKGGDQVEDIKLED